MLKETFIWKISGSYVGNSGVSGGYGDTVVKRYQSYARGLKKGESSAASNNLKTLKMEFVSNRDCSSVYTQVRSDFAVAPVNMCAVSEEGDLCGDGDKGAGLVIPGSDDRCIKI